MAVAAHRLVVGTFDGDAGGVRQLSRLRDRRRGAPADAHPAGAPPGDHARRGRSQRRRSKGTARVVQNPALQRRVSVADELLRRARKHAGATRFHSRDARSAERRAGNHLLCVGASSEEVSSGVSFEKGRAEEERRAARRAERIAVWVRGALTHPIPVRKLNVGHHAPTGQGRDTSNQRRVVIILVLDGDEKTDVDQALREAMAHESARAPIFDALLTQYFLANGPTFTWVE